MNGANTPEFDRYAEEYDAALNQGISVSGENKEFFAQGRIRYLAGLPEMAGIKFDKVLDYGCGTGSATPYLLEHLPVSEVIGVDISAASLTVARQQNQQLSARFATPQAAEEIIESQSIPLAFCNGVFHHIPPAERSAALRFVFDALRPGALWAFWENNPWNPGTRLVMRRCPFDRDAVTITPPEARRMLQTAGFEIVRTDYLFIFPAALAALRALEPPLARWPLGAQYQVLCRKPQSPPDTR